MSEGGGGGGGGGCASGQTAVPVISPLFETVFTTDDKSNSRGTVLLLLGGLVQTMCFTMSLCLAG